MLDWFSLAEKLSDRFRRSIHASCECEALLCTLHVSYAMKYVERSPCSLDCSKCQRVWQFLNYTCVGASKRCLDDSRVSTRVCRLRSMARRHAGTQRHQTGYKAIHYSLGNTSWAAGKVGLINNIQYIFIWHMYHGNSQRRGQCTFCVVQDFVCEILVVLYW